MSNPIFHLNDDSNIVVNPSYPHNHTNNIMDDYGDDYFFNHLNFHVSNYISTGEENSTSSAGFNHACVVSSQSHHQFTQEITSSGSTSSSNFNGVPENSDMQVNSKRGVKRDYKVDDDAHVYVFRTKTQLETMDDGYKWRKYGKKTVKTNPNPRNYYKCMSPGCKVKKKVERDAEDASYVITSYEGIHNHESPCIAHYNYNMPSPPPSNNQWSLQASQYYA